MFCFLIKTVQWGFAQCISYFNKGCDRIPNTEARGVYIHIDPFLSQKTVIEYLLFLDSWFLMLEVTVVKETDLGYNLIELILWERKMTGRGLQKQW